MAQGAHHSHPMFKSPSRGLCHDVLIYARDLVSLLYKKETCIPKAFLEAPLIPILYIFFVVKLVN